MEHLLKQKQGNKVAQIIQAIINWDAESILPLLDQNKTYQDLSPKDFVSTIKMELWAFKRSRDTKLILGTDLCKGCNCKEPIFVLKGNNSGREYALYFEFENDEIVDIYQCNWYGNISFEEITFEGKDNLRVTF